MSPNWPLKDKTAVVGIGESEYWRHGGATETRLKLACRAAKAAVEDAGLSFEQIDGVAGYGMDRTPVDQLASTLGIRNLRFANTWHGGGGGVAAVAMNAAMAVATGSANYVLCYRALVQGEEPRYGSAEAYSEPLETGTGAFTGPFGMLAPAQWMAPRVRRYMHDYGVKREDFAPIPLAAYDHAQHNPRAVMNGRPLTLEKYLDARPIVEPIYLYDCCQESDGAAAFIVTTAERAADLKQAPAYITGAVQGSGMRSEAVAYFNSVDYVSAQMVTMGPELFERAELSPEDVDTAQMYETFVPMVMMAMEDLGFCKRGEGPGFVADGKLSWPDGGLPFNTSGGNLAEAYMHGFELVNEAVRQLRGDAACQVDDAEVCLVSGGPGASLTSAMLLRR